MQKDELLKAIDFEIQNFRESQKLPGISLWAIGISISALLSYIYSKSTSIAANYNDAINILIIFYILLLVHRAGINLIELLTPWKRIKPRMFNLTATANKSQTVRILLIALAGTMGIIAYFHYFLVLTWPFSASDQHHTFSFR